MTLNRRDLLKTAAVAVVPGSLLLDAACGGVLPPEEVPKKHPDYLGPAWPIRYQAPPKPVHSDFSVSRFTARVMPGYTLVFPCGYSKIAINAYRETTLEVVKTSVFFDVKIKNIVEEKGWAWPKPNMMEFSGAVSLETSVGNPLPLGNRLRIIAATEGRERREYGNHYTKRELGQWIKGHSNPDWSIVAFEASNEEEYWKLVEKCCMTYATYARSNDSGWSVKEFFYGRIKRKTA